MPRPNNSALAAALLAALAGLIACREAPSDAVSPPAAAPAGCANGWQPAGEPPPAVGIMTSLPFFFPLGAEMDDVLSGAAELPWQQFAIARCYTPVPLDTLSPGPGVAPEDIAAGPLAGTERLAVIQPRGLSPADNVALDAWVRGGGRLFMALDPALTGDYDLPLGDPRRPVDSALIPPVVARWGLAVSFDETQPQHVTRSSFAESELPLALSGRITITDQGADRCVVRGEGAIAVCPIGKGRVTLLADAALFEHPELAGNDGEAIATLLAAAFE